MGDGVLVEVTVSDVRAAGRSAVRLSEQVGATSLADVVEEVSVSLADGQAAHAATDLAQRWTERVRVLAVQIDSHGRALTAAAKAYADQDERTASSLEQEPQ